MKSVYFTPVAFVFLMSILFTPVLSFAQNQKLKDTITYRAQLWAEKQDIQRYGGREVFWDKLQQMFENITTFWNESPNKFEYRFVFKATGLKIYDNHGNPDNYDKNREEAAGPLNTSKYDFVVFLALNAKRNGLWAGSGASGQSIVVDYKTLEHQKKHGGIFSKQPPEFGEYGNIGHEFGHYRGATDLYQYMIKAENNPVNHVAYNPPKSIMRYAQDQVWDDYCSYLFNYTAHQKQLDKNLLKEVFPDKLKVQVLTDGEPQAGVTVKFFGTRAGGANNDRDVYPKAYHTFTTNKDGYIMVNDVYRFYHPIRSKTKGVLPPENAFPYNYWFSFVIQAEYNGEKKYIWLPDWKAMISKLKGNEVDVLVFSF